MGVLYELAGKNFGRLTVVCRAEKSSNPKDSYAYWLCSCSCGDPDFVRVKGVALLNGSTSSCGCYQKEMASTSNKTHGMTRTRIYRIWQGMKQRCYYGKSTRYKSYGARNIKVCDEWINSFETFRKWSLHNGYTDDLTLDRIDSNGNYTPNNCRWANMEEQQNNRRNNRLLTFDGKTHTMAEWEKLKGLPKGLLYSRLNHSKWPLEKALTAPVRKTKRGRQNASICNLFKEE